MESKIKKAIEEYQCSGCVRGSEISECFRKVDCNEACGHHSAGTMSNREGRLLLGMPTGFRRIGTSVEFLVSIFPDFKSLKSDWKYDKYNIPCWKHLDEHGNTLVRGLSPRINRPFLHVILGNNINEIDCLEITGSDLYGMD